MEQTESIRILTKTLSSGNCQVTFFLESEEQPQYGYLLLQEKKSVSEILEEIKQRVAQRKKDLVFANPFLSIVPRKDDYSFYLFSA